MVLHEADNQAQPAVEAPGASAVDTVVRQIREMIAEARLTVGDNLPTERELSLQFNASRNTVREAMRILKAYGMVDVRPKVGATIIDNRMARVFDLLSFNTMEVSHKTFNEVQEFRTLLEVGSAEQVIARITDRDVDELRAINERLVGIHNLQEASEVDYSFHIRLLSILDNDAILDVYKVMKPVIQRIMLRNKTRRTFKTETYSEHDEVIEALAARDRLGFQYRLRNHLLIGFKTFNEEMARVGGKLRGE